MGFFGSLDVSASALTAQRLRMDVISENIANVDTTRTPAGGPYQRKVTIFEERPPQRFADILGTALSEPYGRGVRVSAVTTDTTPGTRVYEPGHPDAGPDGYVNKPNVNVVVEMVNMIDSTRSYEANVTTIGATKAMIAKTLEISR